ncbi:hypothetical protein BVX99_03185 [bacterium F16]|nr:hypothetical protein BVX99_03185 [bacterium F16]
MKLVYTSGSNEGKEIELKAPFISLGRETDNDVQLNADEASRYHAKIEKDGSIWIVRDLGSSNGVRLNGQKIDESAPLEHNDELRLGGSVFSVIDPEKVGDDSDVTSATTAVGDKPAQAKSIKKGDESAQKRIRLMMTGLIAMILAVASGYLVPALLQEKKSKPQLSVEAVRKSRLKTSPLHVIYKHETSGYDAANNDYNLSLYEVVIDDHKLSVRVENLNDGVSLNPGPVEISEGEEMELKMKLLEADDFVKAESLPVKERDNSYDRLELMVRAGNRGNAVEYINESGLLPAAVVDAIDHIKGLVERKLDIPRMSRSEAFARAEELLLLGKRNYAEKRSEMLNLYKAIQQTDQALVILSGYKQTPEFFPELQELNNTCKKEHQLFIEDMLKKADIEERTDKERALERYRNILNHIGDINDRDYRAAREKVYLLERALKKDRR